MILKSADNDRSARRSLKRGGRWLAPAIVLVLLCLAVFWARRSPWPGAVRRYLQGLRVQPTILVLDIKYKHFQRLAAIRDEMLRTHAVHRYKDEYVPAVLRLPDRRVKVKLRLKGDRLIHYNHPKQWSFRVRTKGDQTVMGMKAFSLHKPRARNYIYEWLFHRALDREGLIGLRYQFVHLTLNGDNLGIYAMEEHFDKRLVEHHGFREGPILRFDNDLVRGLDRTEIAPYQVETWSGEERRDLLDRALGLLQGFRTDQYPIHKVFDVKKLARYFALTDVLGMHHGALFKSIRFYYNPVTAKLEPIGFDGHFGTLGKPFLAAEMGINPRAGWYYEVHGAWFRKLFNREASFDPVFYQAYLRALTHFCQAEFLDGLFADLDEELSRNLALIHRDFAPRKDHINAYGPALFEFSQEPFYQRQKYIRGVFEEQAPRVYAEAGPPGERVRIEIRHLGKLPMKIAGVRRDGVLLAGPEEALFVFPTAPGERAEPRAFYFGPSTKTTTSQEGPIRIEVIFELPGTTITRVVEAMPRPFPLVRKLSSEAMHQRPNADQFPWLLVDEERALIVAQGGARVLDRTLVLPPGYRLRAEPGFSLDLVNQAKIISYASLHLAGSPEEPIVIYSSDRTGQGLAVIDAGTRSELEYVRFEDLSNPQESGWALTGAVTFYQSPVSLREVVFLRGRCEDALNIVRSPFNLSQVSFTDLPYDAFDADFSDGGIRHCSFQNCGNDAVDVSGGRVTIQDTTMIGIGDKGVSAGENSHVTATRLRIDDALVGLASKDLSFLEIDQTRIQRTDLDLAVYQKKSEFGRGTIAVGQLTWSGAELNALIEEGSLLSIRGTEIEPNCKEALKRIERLALYRRYRQKAEGTRP